MALGDKEVECHGEGTKGDTLIGTAHPDETLRLWIKIGAEVQEDELRRKDPSGRHRGKVRRKECEP